MENSGLLVILILLLMRFQALKLFFNNLSLSSLSFLFPDQVLKHFPVGEASFIKPP